ncbi:MAG: fructose-1-phosphate kinase [Alicyclobacillus sp. RIFOXYA1_FULL_53_8]|nr:MAG: fructose-1-phosphate kinase [Alicyclobacillus sp. RIFOXYA1_FULL_53_8]
MSELLPPKTCSVDRMITNQDDVLRVTSGRKTATRRNGRYADEGEVFELDGQRFQVSRVYRQRLSDMSEEDFRREGFENRGAYLTHISSLHGNLPITVLPAMQAWVHEFFRLGE